MTTSQPPDRIRAHLAQRGAVADDVHAVADAAWELLSGGLLDLPLPGGGATITRWWALAEIAAFDLAVAQLAEGHLEAQTLHAEAGRRLPDGLWGSWVDDAVDDLHAEPDGDGWVIEGTRGWCVGARTVSAAVVSAMTAQGARLFAMPTRDEAVRFDPDSGHVAGLALADPLRMSVQGLHLRADAEVGPVAGWYRSRPGYWATAAGNAAVWYGGALGVARAVRAAVDRRADDPFGLANLGLIDAMCAAIEAVLSRAARVVDANDTTHTRTVAIQARAAIELLATRTIREADQVLTGRAVAGDPPLARRLADLTMALRRHGGRHELTELGTDALLGGRLT